MFFTTLRIAWALTGGLVAAPQTAPPTMLTTKEVEAGWIQLFDNETSFGWAARGNAEWGVKEGAVYSSASTQGMGMLCTTSEFGDFELHAEAWAEEGVNSGIMIRAPREGDITADNSYEVNLFDPHPQWPTGSINNLKKSSRKIKSVGRWIAFDILAEGEHLVVKINGKKTLDAKDSKHARGVIALQSWGKEGSTVRFRNIKLRPLSLKSILNGKDLTGWKPLPGKSVYSATPEGWLNIKNGGGEIQSEGQWTNFVLQLDIFSNGDHLNSGVFFREDPGGYWQGYESQIRNQWEGDNRSKPVDFGTGGLYFYHPARKVIPSDREWFTKTIICDGAHFAIWINGFQTTDFTDKRQEKPTAREGLRLKGGAIGLQGHDPTTDLSFRNIRVGELPSR